MKTVAQAKVKAKNLEITTANVVEVNTGKLKNNCSAPLISAHTVLITALLSGSLSLVGCQTIPANVPIVNNAAANNTAIAAKTTLAKALQKQRRQSFSYHSNLQINNDQQFANNESTQLVATDDVDSYCVDTHDQAYADLMVQSEAMKKEISDITFETQRSSIKQSYIDCSQAYEVWRDQQDYDDGYYDDEYNNYDEGNESDDSIYSEDDEMAVVKPAQIDYERVGQAGATIVETSRIRATGSNNPAVANDNGSNNDSNDEAAISPYYQQLFDSYDSKTSVLDIKKAKLLDAYLLKPLSINAQGVYQPLAGRFTMLGSVQYQSRNNISSINQPIYVDLKSGNIYLWADNFAMFNSELLDNKLGVKWQNKWLRLAIDDGTLPKGFGPAVIKAHFKALDRAYEQADISQFDFIAPNSLLTLAPKLPKQQLAPMMQSPQIIRRTLSAADYKQLYADYINVFYNDIVQQYPELIAANSTVETDQLPLDAESLSSQTFSSQAIVQKVLSLMKKAVNETGDDVQLLNSPTQYLYGFDNKGQLQWSHERSQVSFATGADDITKPQPTIDMLQHYLPLQRQDALFPNLPKDAQIPNASNSVDIRAYSKELAESYRKGNGTVMGKMLFNMISMYKIQAEASTSELEEEATEAVIETAE